MKPLATILVSVLLLQSCNYNDTKSGSTDEANKITAATPETTISYELIRTNTTAVCLNCHSGTRKPDLMTKEDLIFNSADILAEIFADDMPLDNPPLTACQKATLQKWFDLGAPDQSDVTIKTLPECASGQLEPTATPEPTATATPVPTPVPTPDPETCITYKLITADTAAICLNCHKAGARPPDLSTREKYLDNAADVLSEVMANTMPRRAPPLTDCQKATLKKWLDMGAPEESQTTVSSLPECKI